MNDFRSFIALSEAKAARTITGAFNRFLDSEINISAGKRSSASTSQNHLREFLVDEAGRDETFPRVLTYADSDFLGGSFARHTKIWPLDDIDVYFPLDAGGLVYSRGGVVQAFSPLSDNVFARNPLLEDPDRWMIGSSISSKKLIDGFGKVLRRHYQATTKVRRVGEAVNVTLASGLGFDVVPCISLQPQLPWQQHFYLIPDGYDSWIHTNPRIDQEMSKTLHRNNDKTLRRAVKLFKWFIGEELGGHVESYYSELEIMRAFELENSSGRYITEISIATALAFRAVKNALGNGNQEPLLENAPEVERGLVTMGNLARLKEAVEQCDHACWLEANGQVSDALKAWQKVFGDKFPA